MERLIAQLVAELDDPEAVETTAHNAWSIYLDGDVEVQLHLLEDETSFFLCDIGKTPVETDALERLLLANSMGWGTNDSILGIEDAGDRVTLRRWLSAGCTFRELRETLEDFYNAAFFWKAELPTLGALHELHALARRKTGP